MTEQIWSARVGSDALLLVLWFGIHGLSAGAIFLGMVVSGVPLWLTVPTGGLIGLGFYFASQIRPGAWFEPGNMVLDKGRGRWQANGDQGEWVDGVLRLEWRGEALVGVTLVAPAGRRSVWLTRRRVGNVAWWQLQRWIRLNE